MSINKIHLVGAQETNYPWGFENRIIAVCERLGVEVLSTDYRKRRAELADLIQQPADMVLVCRGEGIPPEVIRKAPCPTALWYAEQIGTRMQTDDAANERRRELGYNIKAFDVVFSHDQGNLDIHRALGARNVWWLPTAIVEPEVHRKLDVPKTRDVVFVGRLTPRRQRILREIASDGYEVSVLNIWDPHELNHVFNEARVVLNLHLSDLPNTETRIAEVLGSGSFLLSDVISSTDLVSDAEHCAIARTGEIDELIAKLAYYLKHEDERESIAASGHLHMHTHHTFAAHLRSMFDIVEQTPVERPLPKRAYVQGAAPSPEPARATDRERLAVEGTSSQEPATTRGAVSPHVEENVPAPGDAMPSNVEEPLTAPEHEIPSSVLESDVPAFEDEDSDSHLAPDSIGVTVEGQEVEDDAAEYLSYASDLEELVKPQLDDSVDDSFLLEEMTFDGEPAAETTPDPVEPDPVDVVPDEQPIPAPRRSVWPRECGVLYDVHGGETQDLEAFYAAVRQQIGRQTATA